MSSKQFLTSLILQHADLINQLIENDGALSPELESQLAHIELSLPEKVDATANLLERLKMEKDWFKAKADEYAALARGCDRVTEKIKEVVKHCMAEVGQSEVFGNDVRFKLSPSQGSLVIDEKEIDLNYCDQIIQDVPNKAKIKAAIDSGIPVKGAHIVAGYQLRTYPNKKSQKESK